MKIKKDIIFLGAISIVFYALAFLKIFSEYDALVWVLGVSLIIKKIYYPCLLLLIAGLQDGPGFSYLASYLSFSFIAWLLITREFITKYFSDKKKERENNPISIDFKKLVFFAILVSIYGVILSFFQDYFQINPQAQGRFYGFVFFFMVTMILAGYFSVKLIFKNPRVLGLMGFIALISIVHILIVGILQITFGAESYRSETMIPVILEKKQLYNVTALNIARINGPFLSPNAMGMTILLFSIIVFINSYNKKFFAMTQFMTFGLLGAILSLSKAVLGYYILCCAIMLIFQFKNLFLRIFAFSLIFIVGIATVLIAFFESSILQNSFRIKTDGLGTRDDVWQSVIEGLTAFDWTFGIGLSAWPVFFYEKLGYTLSDPHTYILSVPGTFGLIGVFFYFFMLIVLYSNTFIKNNLALPKTIGILLLVLFFGRDIASIPSILGNTQTNYIVWILLGVFFLLSTSKQKSTK